MKFRHQLLRDIIDDKFLEAYEIESKKCLSAIRGNKGLTIFDGFNKRLKLNIGMEIHYNHNMSGIVKDDTQDLYRYMMKISDLWFAYEHLTTCAHLQGLIMKFSKRGHCDTYK